MNWKDEQPMMDAEWIAEAHEDPVEDDVDALMREVRRLRDLLTESTPA